jgi:hypothetical protein
VLPHLAHATDVVRSAPGEQRSASALVPSSTRLTERCEDTILTSAYRPGRWAAAHGGNEIIRQRAPSGCHHEGSAIATYQRMHPGIPLSFSPRSI